MQQKPLFTSEDYFSCAFRPGTTMVRLAKQVILLCALLFPVAALQGQDAPAHVPKSSRSLQCIKNTGLK